MLQILRLAAFEIKFLLDVPTKVVIDEYVGIAASFFDETKVTFVNAVIDGIAKKNGRA
jgi:N utilization substance protein B